MCVLGPSAGGRAPRTRRAPSLITKKHRTRRVILRSKPRTIGSGQIEQSNSGLHIEEDVLVLFAGVLFLARRVTARARDGTRRRLVMMAGSSPDGRPAALPQAFLACRPTARAGRRRRRESEGDEEARARKEKGDRGLREGRVYLGRYFLPLSFF